MYSVMPVFWWFGVGGVFLVFLGWVVVVGFLGNFFRILMLIPGCSGMQFHLSTASVSRCLLYFFRVMSNSSTMSSTLTRVPLFPLNL